MTEEQKTMADGIPLSRKAKYDLRMKDISETAFPSFLAFFFGMLALMFLVLVLSTVAESRSIGLEICSGISGLILILGLLYCLKKTRANKKRAVEKNSEDWRLSREVLSLIDYLKVNPPDLKKINSAGLSEIKGLTPIRIDYSSDASIAGELKGTMKGSGLGFISFSFKGEFFGRIEGKSTPELTDQHAVVICTDELGKVFRLIFPNIASVKKEFTYYFQKLGEKNGWGSYVQEALYQLWQESILDIFAGLNYQHIIDQLVVGLDSPREKRAKINIKGIEAKEGLIIVSFVEAEGGESETVIPTDFMKQVQRLLNGKNIVTLPLLPLLEAGH
jgi:hypothetical protein